jgi:hypothetical protein
VSDARTLGLAAYNGMVRRVSEAQQHILLHEALIARFGQHAIPANAMLHGHDTLTTGISRCHAVIATYEKTIDRLTPLILELEAVLARERQADMEAFADFIRSRRPEGAAS